MTTAFYRNGTVAVTQGSKVVTGTGTNWATGATKPLAGDVFIFKNKIYEVEHVISNTEIRLFRNFEDATATAQTYVIMRNASLNISSRIAAQVAQVVNQKQIMLDEFHELLTNDTDPTVNLTDTLGNPIPVTPIPMLDASHNQAIKDLNDKADQVISSNILMDESEARAINATNNNHFDASGMIHMGKHRGTDTNYVAINEGLFTRSNNPSANTANSIFSGTVESSVQSNGSSKTKYPVMHIAGSVINHKTGVNLYQNENTFFLPEAEDGTRIYDSTGDCRGSGKASLDLKVDVDPKYGDAPTGTEAQIIREAQGRAFEGEIKNGDMRLGDNGDWVVIGSGAGTITVDNSGVSFNGDNASASCYAQSSCDIEANVTYEVEFFAEAFSNTNVRIVVGNATHSGVVDGLNKVVLTSTKAAATVSFNPRVVNLSGKISNVSVRKVTEEVVTHPVDLVGLEYYEEELTGRQEVFECIQSLGTTFGTTGVPTVLSTRKLSYFQQYDGQFPEVTANPDFINDRYRCVVWDELSEPDKRKIAAYMKERLFMGVNKKPVNGRLRGRTIRGLKNGDWRNTDASGNATGVSGDTTRLVRHAVGTGKYVKPQGNRDVVPADTDGYPIYDANKTYPAYSDGGVFSAYKSSSVADDCSYQGRCFMYVVATVPRACKAAYVKGLNEFGTGMLQSKRGAGFSEAWYASNAVEVNTLQDTFTMLAPNTGAIGQLSGHPDGIFYDGIEAGGLNGVIDWRLSAVANDSPEEAAKVEVKVENGTYRGLEKLVQTQVIWGNLYRNRGGSVELDFGSGNIPSTKAEVESLLTSVWGVHTLQGQLGQLGYVHNRTNGQTARINRIEVATSKLVAYFTDDLTRSSNNTIDLVITAPGVNSPSVSGEFNTQMVIADPVNILLTDALKDGWLGTWCDVIPVGGLEVPLTRFGISTNLDWVQTTDNGTTWISGTRAITKPQNATGIAPSVDTVTICSYKAFTKQTKLSTNKSVYNAKAGLMGVFTTMSAAPSLGATLFEALLGKVSKHNTPHPYVQTLSLTKHMLSGNGDFLAVAGYEPEHTEVGLIAPINNSQAVKALPYQISNNGQASIGYQANELTWDAAYSDNVQVFDCDTTGTVGNAGQVYICKGGQLAGVAFTSGYSGNVDLRDAYLSNGKIVARTTGVAITYLTVRSGIGGWGDDSTIKITTDGSDTFVDLNGNANLSVVHELAIPYSWTSNHARAGMQVPGVDL